MCGIFVHIGEGTSRLKEATDIISHRGPDSNGFLNFNHTTGTLTKGEAAINQQPPGLKVQFGFRRLAIIDLQETANQPFSSKDGLTHVIFNGEIYNYLEIRSVLQQKGYTFVTESDTEVLLTAYQEWGDSCVSHFNGMWAFAILDIKQNIVFASRDRFGIKPFYYGELNGNLIFCSELKQFFASGATKVLNEGVLRSYLVSSVLDASPETFFEGVNRLPAGCSIKVPLDEIDKYRIYPYWSLEAKSNSKQLGFEESKNAFKELFYDSIKLRFRSDVPVGICLSGGLDSSSIASVSADLGFGVDTFTSYNDMPQFDETDYVREVIKKYPSLQSHYYKLTEKDFHESLNDLIISQDEPIAGLGVLAQWSVMKLAKEHNIKVLLDGQGGDEVLGGYRKYYFFFLKELLLKRRLSRFFKEGFTLVSNRDFNPFDMEGIRRYTNRNQSLGIFKP